MPLKYLVFTLVSLSISPTITLSQTPQDVFCNGYEVPAAEAAAKSCAEFSICVSETRVQTCTTNGCEEIACDAGCVKTGQNTASCVAALETCEDVEEVYAQRVAVRHCSGVQECQVLFGMCGIGLGGCWHATNTSVPQADLESLAVRFLELGCSGPICACSPPPQDLICSSQQCDF